MFSPLLKSCFPYASPYPIILNNDETNNTIEQSTQIAIPLSRSNSHSIISNDTAGTGDDGGATTGSNNGKRYSPPCEPPPPTPTLLLSPSSPLLSFKRNNNAKTKVSEIEYAVPFIHRYENFLSNNNCNESSSNSNIRFLHNKNGFQAVYENVNASNDNCGIAFSQVGNITDYRGEEIVQVRCKLDLNLCAYIYNIL